jgi:hypothetical protein
VIREWYLSFLELVGSLEYLLYTAGFTAAKKLRFLQLIAGLVKVEIWIGFHGCGKF